jgi:ACS family hexuronate transporter-like MFS transporter
MSLGIFCAYLATPCYWAIIQDSVKSNSVGRVGGFVHFLSNLAGIFAPSITGFIVQATGSFTSAFLLTGVLAAVGALTVASFARPIRDSSAIA